MLRYRMNKILKLLEQNRADAVLALADNKHYRKALLVLYDTGAVNITRAWGGQIVRVFLCDHYATCQLDRQEIWINRVLGFITGICTSVATAILLVLIPQLL